MACAVDETWVMDGYRRSPLGRPPAQSPGARGETPLSLKSILETQLRHRFVPETSNAAAAILIPDEDVSTHMAEDPASYCGRCPLKHADLVRAIARCRAHFTASCAIFALSGAQVQEDEELARVVRQGYAEWAQRLQEVYDLTFQELRARGVAPQDLRVVAMVAAGGAPFRTYGMAENPQLAAKAQVELALRHGFIVDLIPLTLSDFNRDIMGMGLGIGAVICSALQARHRAQRRMDGLIFCCKGTLAAACGVRSYLDSLASPGSKDSPLHGLSPTAHTAHTVPEPLALFGMGTDLAQGFMDLSPSEMEGARQVLRVMVVNSLQDGNVGSATKDQLHDLIGLLGSSSRAVWLDIDSQLQDLGAHCNPDHSWYPMAFSKASAAPLKDEVLGLLAEAVVGARNQGLDPSYRARAPSKKAQELHARFNSRPRGEEVAGLLLQGLKTRAAKAELRPTETRVTHIRDFVSNGSMFIAE